MGQVAIRVNGRTYRLRCGDGEEMRLLALGAHVGDKVEALVKDFGQIGEDKLLLMAALLVCDEYFDARERRPNASVVGVDAAGAASG
jgi:cell division protein ZapA